jgi:hypothetical protein
VIFKILAAIPPDSDAHPDRFNVANGLVDLRRSKVLVHGPS